MIFYWEPYPHFTTRFVFILLVLLSLLGIILSWRKYPASKILLFSILYFYCSTVIFFNAHRFTILILPFLILYASSTLAHLSRHRPTKKAKKRVCIVRHFYYPQDSHVVRNAESLKEAGYEVEVICLQNWGERSREKINGIDVYRLPVRHHRGSLLRYLFEYSAFFLLSGIVLTFRSIVRRYDVIEIDNLPDFLVFAAIIPKLLGAKIVLYMFEPMPEMFQSKFRVKRESLSIKLIIFLERLSTQYADTVIAFSKTFYRVQLSRGLPPSKGAFIYSVPNDRIFEATLRTLHGKTEKNGLMLLYHGTLLKRYGLQDLIQAIVLLKDRIPGLHLEILGEGEYLPTLSNLVKHLGISDQVHFRGYIPYNQIPQAINNADLGIVPMVLNDHTNLTIPIKLFEYVAMKRPVIATRTQAIQVLFDENCIMYFESSNVKQLADRISDLYCSPQKRQQLADKAYTQYQKIKWSSVKEKYCQLIDPSRESEYPD
ncbi:glycosyltransferase family 4 protein [candidate division TA06 bacterium]|nr:glycosyltransferase family 4 protein [candidate division TA06 bacterium]